MILENKCSATVSKKNILRIGQNRSLQILHYKKTTNSNELLFADNFYDHIVRLLLKLEHLDELLFTET